MTDLADTFNWWLKEHFGLNRSDHIAEDVQVQLNLLLGGSYGSRVVQRFRKGQRVAPRLSIAIRDLVACSSLDAAMAMRRDQALAIALKDGLRFLVQHGRTRTGQDIQAWSRACKAYHDRHGTSFWPLAGEAKDLWEQIHGSGSPTANERRRLRRG